MNFDLRIPLGLMFTLFGTMLVGYGTFSESSIYQKSLGMNINLGWGAVMLLFGLSMLGLAWRARSPKHDRKP